MKVKIKEVIHKLELKANAGGTVDRLLSGDAEQEVTGIAVAFMPSIDVIEQTAARGANLLIVHESPYYQHSEPPAGLTEDDVYRRKLQLLEESGIALYRCHDYWHRFGTDGVMMGLIEELGWGSLSVEYGQAYAIVALPGPAVTARELALQLKESLGLSYVRMAGVETVLCCKAGILVGYRGSASQVIPLLQDASIDVVIAGEGPEWEAPEYVRDAAHIGLSKALIMLGHAESEEPGMRYLTQELSRVFPTLKVHDIVSSPVFRII